MAISGILMADAIHTDVNHRGSSRTRLAGINPVRLPPSHSVTRLSLVSGSIGQLDPCPGSHWTDANQHHRWWIIAGGHLPPWARPRTRPLAIAGGWLGLHIPTVASILGPPTDYLFHAVIHIVALSAGIRALRSRCVWRWLGLDSPSASDGLKHEKPRVPARGSATGRHGPYLDGSTIHSIVGPALLAWLTPMVVVWQVYSVFPDGSQRPIPWNIMSTELIVVAQAVRSNSPPAIRFRVAPDERKKRGYWGVGRPGAWSNLDKALVFLARGPQHNLDRHVRFQGAIEGLSRGLHLAHPSLLFIAVLGCFSTLRRRPSGTHLGPALATAWLVGITAAQFMGLMAYTTSRGTLGSAGPNPALLTHEGAFKRSKSYWWILIATLLATLYSTRFPGRSVIHSSPEVKESALNPILIFGLSVMVLGQTMLSST